MAAGVSVGVPVDASGDGRVPDGTTLGVRDGLALGAGVSVGVGVGAGVSVRDGAGVGRGLCRAGGAYVTAGRDHRGTGTADTGDRLAT